jgi:hypothetical protein
MMTSNRLPATTASVEKQDGPDGCGKPPFPGPPPGGAEPMRSNIAVTLLALMVTLNLGTGVARRIDHRVLTVESCLYDKLEERNAADCLLERERRARSRGQAVHGA